jgi:uncharacterized membrane protein
MQTKESRTKKIEYREKKRQISSIKGIVLTLFSLLFSLSVNAQCAMCRAALESEGNTVKAEAVNDGIVYLMGIPYVLVGIVGYVVYRMYRKKKVA